MPLVDLGPAPVKKKDTGLVDLGPAPTPISEALTAIEEPAIQKEPLKAYGGLFQSALPARKEKNLIGDVGAIGKAGLQYIKEGEPYPGEIPDRLKNMITRAISPLAYVMPGVTREGLTAELDKEAERFTGFGPAVVPAAGRVTEMSAELIAFNQAFGAVHKGVEAVKGVPKVARVLNAIEKSGGVRRFAENYPRIYKASQGALQAFLEGGIIGTTYGALEGVEEGDILKRMAVRGGTFGGIAAGFSLASSVDNARYIGKLRKALVANTKSRYTAKIKALPKSATKSSVQGLIQQENLELQQIDNIVSATEAQLIGMKSGKLARGAFEAVESPQKAAQRIIKYGWKPGKGYTVGQPELKTGMGKPPKKPLMPTGKVAQAREYLGEIRQVAKQTVQEIRGVKGVPKIARVKPTPPVGQITPEPTPAAIKPVIKKPAPPAKVAPVAETKDEYRARIRAAKAELVDLGPAPEVKKEIKYEKEAITEPITGPQVEPEKAGKLVPTGKFNPTKEEDALKIIKQHKNWLEGSKNLSAFEGIYETAWDKEVLTFEGKKGGWVKKSVEYTPEQIDTAYRTIQKPIPSSMPDTELFAMPGKEAQMKAIAQKMQKVKPVSRKVKKAVRLTKPAGLPKAKTEKADHIKALYKATAKETTKYAINGVKVEGDTIIATDGRRLFFAKGEWGKDGLYLDAASLKNGLLGKLDKTGAKFPTWRDILPDVSGEKPILVGDLDTIWRNVRQAQIMTAAEAPGIAVIANKDGTLGFATASPEMGHAEINIRPGGKILGGVNPQFLLDVLSFHAIRGNKSFEFYFPDWQRPILTRSFDGKTNTLTMPINIEMEKTSEAIKEATREWPIAPKGKPGFVDLTPIGDLGKFLVGDIEIEPVLEVSSGAFNKHLNYFQGRQLPETSQVRKIQKQMQVVNGQRLAGTITAQDANKKIQQLRKLLFETAQKEGIALRMTKGGKVSVAVRKAGTYVPVEFAEYKKFKDISPILGGGQDITRAIQQMDGSLTVKQKVREKGQAGQLEQNVLWPTRDMSLQKLEWLKEKAAELKGLLKVRKKSKGDKQINLVLEQIASQDRNVPIKKILSNETLRSMANPDIIRQAVKLREFYDNLIDEQNIARRIRGQKEIAYRRNYSPHILRDATIWERVVMMGKKAEDIFATKADLPDYIRPNKPFNPREMAREGGIPYEKRIISARDLAEIYLVTAGKDIFNTSIIQNNKAFIQQLEAMGFKKSADYLADWTAEAYAGVKPRLDRVVGLPVKAQKAALWWNRLRNMAVFPLNFAWNLVVQPSSLALTIGRYGTKNTLQGFLQWLVPSVRRQTAKSYYSYVIKASKQGKITKQDARNLIGSDVKLKMTPGEMIENAGGFFTNQLEKLLTGTSIRAARLHGKKRGLTGAALHNYASDGGAKTQSMYNDEDKPALLRNLTVKTAAPYQTFAYEVVNTAREWYGRTGTPPDTKLYRLWTVLRFLAAATVFAMIGKKLANRDVWSWKRPPIPFAEFWLSPIIKIFSKEYIGGSASGLVSPVGTAQKVAKGIDDVLETGSWRKLRNELIKYGPGIFGIPGGVQISRTVDAIIAYSQGGVRDRRGRLMFKMEDPQDLAQAIFSGVWTTKGGRELIEKRQGKKKEEGKRKKRMEREKRMLRK